MIILQSYYNQPYDYNNAANQYPSASYPTVPPSYQTQSYGSVAGDTGYGYNYNNWQGYGYATTGGASSSQPSGNAYSSGSGGPFMKKKQKKEIPPTIHCDTCGVNCATQDAYTAHITGRKHAIQERKKLQTPIASTTYSDQRYAPYGTTTSNTLIGPAAAAPKSKYDTLFAIFITSIQTFQVFLRIVQLFKHRPEYIQPPPCRKETPHYPPKKEPRCCCP